MLGFVIKLVAQCTWVYRTLIVILNYYRKEMMVSLRYASNLFWYYINISFLSVIYFMVDVYLYISVQILWKFISFTLNGYWQFLSFYYKCNNFKINYKYLRLSLLFHPLPTVSFQIIEINRYDREDKLHYQYQYFSVIKNISPVIFTKLS